MSLDPNQVETLPLVEVARIYRNVTAWVCIVTGVGLIAASAIHHLVRP